MYDEVLSDRKLQILKSSIEQYISSAIPITSLGIKQKYNIDVSSATLRTELNALEAMGYLKQMHTSSGRIPTSKAYRLYVDYLMGDTKFSGEKLELVQNKISLKTQSLNEIISNIAKTISKVTNCPSVVVLDDLYSLIIEKINIIPLIDYNALVLIQTTGGIINNSISNGKDVTKEDCESTARLLSEKFSGNNIKYMIDNINEVSMQLKKESNKFISIIDNVISALIKCTENNIKSGGATKLLSYPEYDPDKVKDIISLIEDDNEIKQAINLDSVNELKFSIGKENEREELKKCSIISSPIEIGGKKVGAASVITPERVDYALVAGALKWITEEIKNLDLIENKGEDNGHK